MHHNEFLLPRNTASRKQMRLLGIPELKGQLQITFGTLPDMAILLAEKSSLQISTGVNIRIVK